MAVTVELTVALSACSSGVLAVTSTTVLSDAELQVDVVTGTVAGFHGKVLGDRCLEPGRLHGDGVVSDRKEREVIVAGAIGLGGALFVRAEVGQGHIRVGNDGARGIGHGSEDVGGGQLARGQRR